MEKQTFIPARDPDQQAALQNNSPIRICPENHEILRQIRRQGVEVIIVPAAGK